MISVTDEEAANLKKKTGKDVTVIEMGKNKVTALQLEKDVTAGTLTDKYYDPKGKSWTSTIAFRKFE